jgi:hypothetical protein
VRNLLIFLMMTQVGCVAYRPVGGTLLPQGTPGRADLTAPMEVRLSEVAVPNTISVSGEIVTHSPDTLTLSVMSVRSATGLSLPAAGETIRIPSARLQSLERRRLDVLRSVLLTAATAVSATLLFSAFDTDSGGSGGGGPTPTPQ